ncbi:4892_t:CDS:2, partial [Racocetra fulgida]
ELRKLIDNDYRLIVPILDALPHFTLEEDLMCNVQQTVFDRLESADLDDLAVFSQYKVILQVVQQIRDKVDFHSIGELQSEALNLKKHQKRNKEQIPEALILDSIKLGIDIHKFVKDAWLKAINDVNAKPYQQQEIVASLVTHIGCGSPIEIESALSVLSHLVKTDIKKMSRFAIFVKGLLDYLDNLNIDQIRVLFDVISKLVYEGYQYQNSLIDLLKWFKKSKDSNYDGSNGGLLAEFSIVIQKQLSNPNEKYKQIGVVGALALVQTLGSTQNAENPNHENTYIIDNDDLAKLRDDHYYLNGMPIEIWFEAECDTDDLPKFNVYPMLCEPHVSQELRMQHLFKRDHVICCCSMLRLVQACLKVKEGSMTEIGALLSTGLLMYEKVDID